MQTYKLYLESGPKKKKTMVHVLDMLGCITKGPTSDESLNRTPEAIRAYLRFLKRHGETVYPDSEFETVIVEHVTEGEWLGSGDPALVFQPDLESLTLEDEEKYIQHLQWSRAEVLALVGGLTNEQIEAEQNAKERSIRAKLEHMLEHEWEHLVELSERLDKPL